MLKSECRGGKLTVVFLEQVLSSSSVAVRHCFLYSSGADAFLGSDYSVFGSLLGAPLGGFPLSCSSSGF